ncbi:MULTISPECIES: PAS domain S-box protein [unclassified Pseudomonas]|uniref:sensor domain-containing diguanylate cyclase n=1 Tax=unclassified Pseudomonas TaxID=196821 RepID=UPI001C464F6A|nr:MULTISPECIES: PAS domain S-box protein [unclassified Pseudomonas]MCU1738366.1 PAS domain S-box protein [Pseudomonas sp. 20S_6.2_Bac1]
MPHTEAGRLKLLHALEVLDTAAEPVFDRLTRLLSTTLGMPIALISLIDSDRQWFKSRVGLDVRQTPRDISFCTIAIEQEHTMVVQDALNDPRFSSNPLVTSTPHIRFYAGAPIRSIEGYALGTLCAIDSKARVFTDEARQILEDFAGLVSREFQMREAALLSRSHITHSAAAFAASEARLKTAFALAPTGIAAVAGNGRFLSLNSAFCSIVGYEADELMTLSFQDITHPDDLDSDLNLLRQLTHGEIDRYQLEKRYRHKDGTSVWVDLHVAKLLSVNGDLEYYIATVQNIQRRKETEASLQALRHGLEQRVEERTAELLRANEMLSHTMLQRLQADRELRQREAELSAVLEHASDAYVSIDESGAIRAWNRMAETTFGWSRDEALGQSFEKLVIPAAMREAHLAGWRRYRSAGDDEALRQRLEISALRRDGTAFPVEVRISPVEIDGHRFFSVFLHDITERKAMAERREKEALTDTLTGLPNRRSLLEYLPNAMARARRTGVPLGVLFLDLDGFKAVNDTFGHEIGDLLLQIVAERLKTCLRETDAVFRLAGDEFTAVVEGQFGGTQDAEQLAKKLIQLINEPVLIGAATVQVGVSIGIAVFRRDDPRTATQLLREADSRMYEAKQAGKGRFASQQR